MWNTAFALASPAGRRSRLSILILHRVLGERDPLFPGEMSAEWFDELCGRLARWFRVLPLGQAVSQLQAGALPARSLVITFDDGYADNHDIALPILRRHGLSATFYIATGYMNGGRMWNDTVIESIRRTRQPVLDLRRLDIDGLGDVPADTQEHRRAAINRLLPVLKYLPSARRQAAAEQIGEISGVELPGDLMMTTDRVRGLARAGMTIGAHTVSHPILASLPAAEAREEIAGSRDWLEGVLGEKVQHFAYPNGRPGRDFNEETVQAVRGLGFQSAVTTAWGAARTGADTMTLPRFMPWDSSPPKFASRMLKNILTA